MLKLFDPMVRLILSALLLASVLPVSGAAKDMAQAISNTAVFLMFLFYGIKLGRAEVLSGLGNLRMLLPLALWIFGAMGMVGWGLWHATASVLPPVLALGFLYLGVLPSTMQSAVAYSSLAGGNTATSVVAAALINIMGVFVSAPLFSLIAGRHGSAFHADALVKVFAMLVLPFVVGQVAQRWTGSWVKEHKGMVTLLDRSAIGIAVYVAFSGAVSQGLWHKLDLAAWGWVLLACAAMLTIGYGGAWLMGGAMRLPRGDRVAMLFAGAQKSAAMGAPLATILFPPAVAGAIIVPLLAYHLAQMVVAAPISSRLAGR